jgi:hypothetical protein
MRRRRRMRRRKRRRKRRRRRTFNVGRVPVLNNPPATANSLSGSTRLKTLLLISPKLLEMSTRLKGQGE